MRMRRFLSASLASVFVLGVAGFAWAEKTNIYDMLKSVRRCIPARCARTMSNPSRTEISSRRPINGMLSSLASAFQLPERKKLQGNEVQTRGEFGGLGIESNDGWRSWSKSSRRLMTLPPPKPVSKAGDYISAINDDPSMGMMLSDGASNKMRGAEGSKSKLTVLREGESEPLEFTLTRAIIHIQSVALRAMIRATMSLILRYHSVQ